MSGIEIRPAIPSDCRRLLKLIVDHARFERSVATIGERALAALLEGDNAPVMLFVADRAGELLGYAAVTFDYSLWRASRWAHLDCLYIKAEVRGIGIGWRLLTYVQGVARLLGADRLEWQTPDWNLDAVAFYRLQGANQSAKVRFQLPL